MFLDEVFIMKYVVIPNSIKDIEFYSKKDIEKVMENMETDNMKI